MGTESENNYETVVIEGEVWAVTSPREDENVDGEADSGGSETVSEAGDAGSDPVDNAQEAETAEVVTDENGPDEDAADPSPAVEVEAEGSEATEESEEDIQFDSLYEITKLLVGGAIEGTSQLTTRLKEYEAILRQEAAERTGEADVAGTVDEDELVRLRYALVGLIFDAQATLRRNVTLWAKLADRSARATNRVTQPVTNSFIFSPVRRRYDRLIQRGEESLARWIADGRDQEQPSRELALMTYGEIVDEFIDRLSENPQLQAVITKQSISVASDMRDEVRERTVTADNLVEGLVRRVLRRSPRAELPEPPPEVQRWAGLSLDEYRTMKMAEDSKDES